MKAARCNTAHQRRCGGQASAFMTITSRVTSRADRHASMLPVQLQLQALTGPRTWQSTLGHRVNPRARPALIVERAQSDAHQEVSPDGRGMTRNPPAPLSERAREAGGRNEISVSGTGEFLATWLMLGALGFFLPAAPRPRTQHSSPRARRVAACWGWVVVVPPPPPLVLCVQSQYGLMSVHQRQGLAGEPGGT